MSEQAIVGKTFVLTVGAGRSSITVDLATHTNIFRHDPYATSFLKFLVPKISKSSIL